MLSYANHKYHIVNDFAASAPSKGISPEKAAKVADRIWEDVSIIDEYIEVYSDEMSEVDIAIVAGWKNAVRGTFVVDRYLRRGSVLVSLDADKKVYLVKGIYSTWREMLGNLPMPQMVEATLIPFQGRLSLMVLFVRMEFVWERLWQTKRKTYIWRRKLIIRYIHVYDVCGNNLATENQ